MKERNNEGGTWRMKTEDAYRVMLPITRVFEANDQLVVLKGEDAGKWQKWKCVIKKSQM